MDDRYNAEFDYYPLSGDSSIRGIGIEVACRGYQWNNASDEDFLIFTYQIKNVSSYFLDKVIAGFYGDPIIGGSGDFFDDYVGYINNNGVDSYSGDTLSLNNFLYT